MTGCSGCRMQLIDGVARFKAGAQVLHPVQALDMAYKAWIRENAKQEQELPKPLQAAAG